MILSPRGPFGLMVIALSALAFAYLLLPLLVVILAPLGETGYLAFPPQGLTLRWYRAALSDPRYLSSFWTSVWIAGIAAILSTAVGIMAAYGLTRGREYP